MTSVAPPSTLVVPQHIAIVMDGNGRWAKQRGLPRIAGHRAGTENIRRIVEACDEIGVKCLTVYAFSTENWNRPPAEVDGLMRIIGEVIERETPILNQKGVRVKHLGSLANLPHGLDRSIARSVEVTKNNTRLTLSVAFNYGGRAEIVEAVRRIVAEGHRPEDVNEELISKHLFTADLPDPDLIIRTANEHRLSNFLLWQSSYAEYYPVPVYWPDFGPEDLIKAINAYSQRQRKFGKVVEAEAVPPAEAAKASAVG
jgi:undecaprenyl diphosphate synthase